MTLKAIYPGTFDPITLGHLDVIFRSLKVVDELVIGIALDSQKNPTFSAEERLTIVDHETRSLERPGKTIVAKTFKGLLVDFAEAEKVTMIIRGLRAVSDFEYEFQMSCINTKLNPKIETFFIPASESTHFIASRFVKEVHRLGGDVKNLVTPYVLEKLNQKKT